MSAPMNMAKRTAAGTLALAVCLGTGALAFSGAANAALPSTGSVVTADTAPIIVPGASGQDAADFSVDLGTAQWSKGDRILLSLPANTGVTFGSSPSASVESKSVNDVSYAPTVTVSKIAAASSGPDRIAITFTNSSPGTTASTATDPSLTLKVTGLQLNVASNAALGDVAVNVDGQEPDNSATSGYGASIAYDHGVSVASVQKVTFDSKDASFPTGDATTLPSFSVKEAADDAFVDGDATLTLSGTGTIDVTKATATVSGSSATATVTKTATEIVVHLTGTDPDAKESVTVSGVKYTPAGQGAVSVTFKDSGALAVLAGDVVSADDLVAIAPLTREAGSDRYATAAAVADELLGSTKVDDVVLTNGGFGSKDGVSIDALSAAYLAGSFGADDAAILLTDTDKLPPATRTALLKHITKGGTVHILGGEKAVSNAVKEELEGLGYVTDRVDGDDRYDTAAKAALSVPASNLGTDWNAKATAILASGNSVADALAAGQYSYQGDSPLLLTEKASVPATTLKAIKDLGIKQVVIVGGTSVISKSVEKQLTDAGVTVVKRIAGDDRYETAADLLNFADGAANPTGPSLHFLSNSKLYLANGYALADASVAAPLAASTEQALIYTDKGSIPSVTKDLIDWASTTPQTVDTVIGIGGSTVLPSSTLTDANVIANS